MIHLSIADATKSDYQLIRFTERMKGKIVISDMRNM